MQNQPAVHQRAGHFTHLSDVVVLASNTFFGEETRGERDPIDVNGLIVLSVSSALDDVSRNC